MAKSSAAGATPQPEELRQQDAQPSPTQGNTGELRETPAVGSSKISDEELRALVAVAAYLRAEGRGFAPGCDVEDWLMAEAEVMARLGLRTGAVN